MVYYQHLGEIRMAGALREAFRKNMGSTTRRQKAVADVRGPIAHSLVWHELISQGKGACTTLVFDLRYTRLSKRSDISLLLTDPRCWSTSPNGMESEGMYPR